MNKIVLGLGGLSVLGVGGWVGFVLMERAKLKKMLTTSQTFDGKLVSSLSAAQAENIAKDMMPFNPFNRMREFTANNAYSYYAHNAADKSVYDAYQTYWAQKAKRQIDHQKQLSGV
jgi:predicted negative regulator of RcsB-dependent stress response